MNLTNLQQSMGLYRQIGDPIADELARQLIQKMNRQQLQELLNFDAQNISTPKEYNDFLTDLKVLPVWYRQHQMQEAAKFFKKYTREIMAILGAYSLPYCYAAADGARVLYLSEKIRKNQDKRLFETASFVVGLFEDKAFSGDKAGYELILKTRLRHAVVRYFTLKSEWNNDWGVPVNQEDMAGTNLAFSLIVLKGLEKFGFDISLDEKNAWLHAWKYIGFLLGIHEVLLTDDLREAYHLERIIERRQLKSSEHGRELTRSLVNHLKSSIPDKKIAAMVESQMRLLMGDKVADILGLSKNIIGTQLTRLLFNLQYLQNLLKEHHSSYPEFIKEFNKMKYKFSLEK
ncbi:MAG: DUF2236 domain-containing protein [Cyclobacteriaceae bacterium]|nr:DUF2236 domain-containing protein [Cyclobacteriaceae bacterium]